MNNFAIAVHGGAGPDSDSIRKHKKELEKGIQRALDKAYDLLEQGGTAVEAVEIAVRELEDDPLFNAGRGGAINSKGEIELCASIMDGDNLQSGAVAIVKNVKNPITLARAVMEKTSHIYLGSYGALSLAQELNLPMEPDAYFITEKQFDAYKEKRDQVGGNAQAIAKEQVGERMHGTVGAVAVDKKGRVAAATSTGGTEYAKEGRIGDSSMIGVGSYANNKTCAVSSTGDGEYLMQQVTCFHVHALMEYGKMNLKRACKHFIRDVCKDIKGDMGIIAVDPKGNVAIEFNSVRMHRGWKTCDGDSFVGIYQEE
jgi:L-asparaginase / beta-aspartyl-peptidase